MLNEDNEEFFDRQIDWWALEHCPYCQEKVTGIQRLQHMAMHTEPETLARLRAAIPGTDDDIFVLCIQEGFDIDGLSADDPIVDRVIYYWDHRNDDWIDIPESSDEPDPDVWGIQ